MKVTIETAVRVYHHTCILNIYLNGPESFEEDLAKMIRKHAHNLDLHLAVDRHHFFVESDNLEKLKMLIDHLYSEAKKLAAEYKYSIEARKARAREIVRVQAFDIGDEELIRPES